jgi:hypothetical protein
MLRYKIYNTDKTNRAQWRVFMLCSWCHRPTGGGGVVSVGFAVSRATF